MVLTKNLDRNGAMVTPEEFQDYYDRVKAIREIIDPFGRGTRSEIAYDLRIAPSRISRILMCIEIDLNLLSRVEDWIAANTTRIA